MSHGLHELHGRLARALPLAVRPSEHVRWFSPPVELTADWLGLSRPDTKVHVS